MKKRKVSFKKTIKMLTILSLFIQLAEKDTVIEHLCHQIEEMKIHFHCLIERADTMAKTPATFMEPQAIATGPACVGQVPLYEDDKTYFSTYSHYDIHHDMLSVSFFLMFCASCEVYATHAYKQAYIHRNIYNK